MSANKALDTIHCPRCGKNPMFDSECKSMGISPSPKVFWSFNEFWYDYCVKNGLHRPLKQEEAAKAAWNWAIYVSANICESHSDAPSADMGHGGASHAACCMDLAKMIRAIGSA